MWDAIGSAINDALPDHYGDLDAFSGGARIRFVTGGWDFHVFDYYQRTQNPIFTSHSNFNALLLNYPLGIDFPWDSDADAVNWGLKARYPHINTVGATFNYFHAPLGIVWRGELGFIKDEPFTGLRQGSFYPGPPTPEDQSDPQTAHSSTDSWHPSYEWSRQDTPDGRIRDETFTLIRMTETFAPGAAWEVPAGTEKWWNAEQLANMQGWGAVFETLETSQRNQYRRGKFDYDPRFNVDTDTENEYWKYPRWDDWFYNDAVEKDTLSLMIGFDRPTWIPFLNPVMTFFITGQFFYKKILDYNDRDGDLVESGIRLYEFDAVDFQDDVDTWLGNNPGGTVEQARDYVRAQPTGYGVLRVILATLFGLVQMADHMTLASLKMWTGYVDDTIKPDILVVWDINAKSGFLKPALAWEPSYNWRYELGGLYTFSDNLLAGPFGPQAKEDLVYVNIKHKF